jgi:adenylate kinase
MKILLIGPPGAGKTVIAEKVSQHFNLPFIKVGSLLRDLKPDNQYYGIIQDAMSKGVLSPNHIVAAIVKDEADKYPQGYIMDGWVRQMTDLEQYDPLVDAVFYMECSKDNSFERIHNRSVCKIDNSIYSFSDKVCSLCGGELAKRPDDNSQVFDQRWKVYEEKTLPVIEYYKKQGKIKTIDADLDILSVLDQVYKLIENFNDSAKK